MKGFQRPPVVTLPENSLVPAANQVEPPASFTHRVRSSAPYWYDRPAGSPPSGRFPAATDVALLGHDGEHSWVADSRGLRVAVDRGSLVELG